MPFNIKPKNQEPQHIRPVRPRPCSADADEIRAESFRESCRRKLRNVNISQEFFTQERIDALIPEYGNTYSEVCRNILQEFFWRNKQLENITLVDKSDKFFDRLARNMNEEEKNILRIKISRNIYVDLLSMSKIIALGKQWHKPMSQVINAILEDFLDRGFKEK